MTRAEPGASALRRGAFELRQTQRGLELFWQGRSLLGPLQLTWELGEAGGRSRVIFADPHAPLQAIEPAPGDGEPGAGSEPATVSRQLRLAAPELVGVELRALLRLSERGLEIAFTVENHGTVALRLGAARLVARPLDDTWLRGVGAQVAWRLFGLGFSSFSPSHSQDTRAVPERPRFPSAATFTLHTQSPYYGQDGALSTPWLGAFTRREGTDAVTAVLGFLSAQSGLGEVALLRGQPPVIEARLGVDGKRLLPGELWSGDPLLVTAAADGTGLLAAWAKDVGARMQARALVDDLPTGWCSWYRYYGGVTERDVLKNLEALAAQRARLPVRYVQLDDGYQKKVGDWLSLNGKFPSGLAGLAARIRAAGFVPGIWLAPFFVQRGARLFREHPEWLLRDVDGELRPTGYHPFWGVLDGHVYALDTTHPGALAYLRHVFTELCAAGFDYFKIDFLFAGLRLGRRYDERQSPVEAYRAGLRAIREAIDSAPASSASSVTPGEPVRRYLLGCGAPLLPAVGLVDGMRISPDVKESWRDPKIAWLTRGATHPAVEQMLPGCMTRAFLHGALWANDPDCLLVREESSQLTLPEVQTLVSVLSLTGGLLVLSDDIAALSAERRALAERVLPPLGEPARALDALTEERPERFVRLHARAVGTGEAGGAGQAGERHEVLAALINWHDGPLERLLVPSELGAELGGVPGFDRRGSLHAFELWSERYERLAPGQSIHSVLPPHGTALWLLVPARLSPQVVSITHHLGQTTTLLLDEAWDAERRTLAVRILAPATRQGRVLVAVPTGMRVRDAEVTGAAELAGRHEGGTLVSIHMTLRPPGRRDESQRDALLTVHFE
ncbi:MAG: glycoside hydrolase family 36 protein [Polyangia bacterium]